MNSLLLVGVTILALTLVFLTLVSNEMRHFLRHTRWVSALLHAGDFENAIAELEAHADCRRPICWYIRRSSSGVGVESRIAIALHEVGETARALEILESLRGRSMRPVAKRAWALAASLVFVQSGRWDEADRALDEGMAVAADDRERAAFLSLRAQRHLFTLGFDSATTAAEEALRLDPACGPALLAFGTSRLARGLFSEAIQAFIRPVGSSFIPDLERKAERSPQARAQVEAEAIVQQRFQWVAGHELAGYASIEAADLNGAEFYLTRAESIRAEQPFLLAPLRLYRALLFAARGEHDRAHESLEKAEEISRRYPKKRLLVHECDLVAGRVSLLAGNLEDALRRLSMAITQSVHPLGQIAACYHLAAVHRQKGDRESARKNLEFVMRRAPETYLAKRAAVLFEQI